MKLRHFLLTFSSMVSLTAVPAMAQSVPAPDHVFDDEGVDINTGELQLQAVDVTVGPRDDALTYQRINKSFQSNHTIYLGGRYSYGPDPTGWEVVIGEEKFVFHDFDYSGNAAPVQTNGTDLSYNSATKIYTFTDKDGDIYTFDSSRGGEVNGFSITPITTIKKASGHLTTYNYRWEKQCVFSSGCNGIPGGLRQDGRVQSITTSNGLQLKFDYYRDANGTTGLEWNDWLKLKSVTGINNADEACDPVADVCSVSSDWPKAQYSEGGYPTVIRTAADSEGRLTQVSSSSTSTAVTEPGFTTPNKMAAQDSQGRVTALDTRGVHWDYVYSTVANTYDGGSNDGALVTRTGPLGVTASTQMDPFVDLVDPFRTEPRVVKTTSELGWAKLTTFSSQDGARLTSNLPVSTSTADGRAETLAYDGRGNVTQTTAQPKTGSGLGNIITYQYYDASCTARLVCNKATRAVDAANATTDFAYSPVHGGLLSVTSPAATTGSSRPESRFTYAPLYAWYKNAYGALEQAAAPIYKLTEISTCAVGSAASGCVGTANETRTIFDYGAAGQPNNLAVRSMTVQAGDGSISATTTLTYDKFGNAIAEDGPLSGTGDTVYRFYNSLKEQIGEIAADPDGAGPRVRSAVRFTRNGGGLVVKVERGTAAGTSLADLLAMTVLQSSEYTFDSDNRLAIETAKGTDGSIVSLAQISYDALGRRECTALRMDPSAWGALPSSACTLGIIGADGPDRVTKFTYDPAGNVTKTQSGYGTGDQSDDATYTYNPNGTRANAQDAEVNLTSYSYDGFDRLETTYFPASAHGAGASSSADYERNTYDAKSQVTVRRLRDGTDVGLTYDNLGRVTFKDSPGSEPDTTYTFDLLDRPQSVVRNGQTDGFIFDALGRLAATTDPLGAVTNHYDAAGRRTAIDYPGAALTVNYDYDTLGNVTAIRENGATSGAGVLATYAYDSLGRRQSVTFGNGSVQSFGYDAASRLSSLTSDLGGSINGDDLAQTFLYNAAGQIKSQTRTGDAYAWTGHVNVDRNYGVNGLNQLTQSGSIALGYDARGNLTSSGTDSYTYDSENRMLTGPNNSVLAYDPLGRLTRASGGGGDSKFLYDGDHLLTVYNQINGVVRRYVYGPGADEPILFYKNDPTLSASRRFLMADERSSVISMADTAGATSGLASYDEYGIPNVVLTAHGYTGQVWLSGVGMWYYKARLYSPSLGRFMQTDPIGYDEGINWYNYVGSDPINGSDSSGLFDNQSVGDCGTECIVVTGSRFAPAAISIGGDSASGTSAGGASEFDSLNPIVVTGIKVQVKIKTHSPKYGGASYGSPPYTDFPRVNECIEFAHRCIAGNSTEKREECIKAEKICNFQAFKSRLNPANQAPPRITNTLCVGYICYQILPNGMVRSYDMRYHQ